jgi:catechol 2,3-dioxygenase-like lactoylglutathione lyase family enzyme
MTKVEREATMPINGLNHVNIITTDLPATVAFYETVLGMEAKELPMALPPGFDGRWIADSHGAPIIHLQAYNPDRHALRPGEPNGTIDHVALTCGDFDGIKARCEELGVAYRVNDRQVANLRQIFVTDPNGVVLELNFAGE